MSQENLEIVRRAYEAFDRGDIELAVSDADPQIEYVASGAVPGFTDRYRGPDGLKEFLSWLRDEFADVRVDVSELLDAGDDVVVSATARGRGKLSGAQATWDTWQVWTLRDGRLVRGAGFTSREHALEAAGVRA